MDVISSLSIPLRYRKNQDATGTILDIDGSGEEIHYYGINGRRFTLSREIEVSFLNLEWDDEQSDFIQTERSRPLKASTIRCFLRLRLIATRFSQSPAIAL